MFRKFSGLVVLCSFLLATGVAAQSAAHASSDPDGGVIALFDGRWIELSEGWGEARACTSDGVTTICYRSEAEMDQALDTPALLYSVALFASCSSSLRLYRSTSYGGAVLQLTTRYTFINLSGYGFDNDTSSYRVGACAAYFYDGANGSGTVYPGPTGANASAASMLAGWDNRVSSVYIT